MFRKNKISNSHWKVPVGLAISFCLSVTASLPAFAQAKGGSMGSEPASVSRKQISKRYEKLADAYNNSAKCYDDTAKTVNQCRQMLSQALAHQGISSSTAQQVISALEQPQNVERGGQMVAPQ